MIKFLEHPLNSKIIMRKKKTIKRELLKNENLLEKKIAILGGSTTSDIRDVLELFLLSEKIKPVFYESEYNKYYEDAFFSEELLNFNPDIIYIHTTYRNILEKPDILLSDKENKEALENEYEKYFSIWEKLKNKYNCIIIQNNFDYPKFRPHGNLERVNRGGMINFIDRLNLKFSEYAEKNKSLIINDINYLSSSIGLEKWNDLNLWYGYKYAISFDAIPHLCKNLSNIIKSLYGKSKKCLVLDLDNTLWGGIIGDDGVENIKIGKENAIAEAYTGFQEYIKVIKNRGITLAISSKNEDNIAREGLNHKDMMLKEQDFFTIKANWNPKFLNIEEISKEINIGLDSLVFLDDNPAERELVDSNLMDVIVPDIGKNIVDYIDYIDKNGYFEITSILNEDLKREEYYKENKEREKIKHTFKDYSEFLNSLEMVAEIEEVSPIYYDRVTQLTNKTNQFNLTTKRYALNEIKEVCISDNKIALYGRLQDKFGDNGLISIILGNITEDELHIDLWLMSCRVLKRNMELAMLDKLVEEAQKKGIKKIFGYYYKTRKNNMVKEHYENLGFKCMEKKEESSVWSLEIKEIKKLNKNIEIKKY